jgi:WhiB family redox-sensing transcriptional regulator
VPRDNDHGNHHLEPSDGQQRPLNHDDLWEQHALCRQPQHDPDLWFPERGQGNAAKKICASCPVRVDCLRRAVDAGEEFGIWGGAGELTRRHLRNALDENGEHAYAVELQDHFDRLDEFKATGRQPAGPASRALGAGATHGKASTYNRGCRCEPCREAKLESLRRTEQAKRDLAAEAIADDDVVVQLRPRGSRSTGGAA